MTSNDAQRLASTLANAALASDWDADHLRLSLFRVVGRRRAWLRDLAAEVLAAHPRPPADRPRELAVFILASAAFERARVAPRPLPVPKLLLPAPTSTVRRPFRTPRIDDAGALADLLGITIAELDAHADTRLRARRARSAGIAHYRYEWVQRSAGARLLEVPKPRLRSCHRQILDDILASIPVHPACHGFVLGRSAITGAREHVGAQVVVTLDLEHFFASVTAARVWGVLRAAGYPEPVAHLLTGLTTHATPVAVLASMPSGRDPSRDFRLRRRLAAPHLPQGASTSPQLANLVLFSLDRRLAALAESAGATYTRYADDLTFSGTRRALRGNASGLIATVGRIVREEAFRLHPDKTRVRHAHERQSVTGIVVNRRLNVARSEYDQVKAMLHEARLRGPGAANRSGQPDFRAHLLGRISWIASTNPGRGARLRASFETVDWSV